MKILFDHGTPVPLRRFLSTHDVATAFERGWSDIENGALLRLAEEEGFACLVTTDQNIRYQQNLSGRKLAIVVIRSTSWPRIQNVVSNVTRAIEGAVGGGYVEVDVP